jgi:hypothetical protein
MAGEEVRHNVGAVIEKHMDKIQANIKKQENERMKKLRLTVGSGS